MAPLFHPRRNRWEEHLAVRGAIIVGLTAIGRATAAVLALNRPARVMVRQSLIQEGWFADRDARNLPGD